MKTDNAVDYIVTEMRKASFTQAEAEEVLFRVGKHFNITSLFAKQQHVNAVELTPLKNLTNPEGTNCPGTL